MKYNTLLNIKPVVPFWFVTSYKKISLVGAPCLSFSSFRDIYSLNSSDGFI